MTFVAAALGAGAGYLAADTLGVSALTGVLGGAAIGGQLGGGAHCAWRDHTACAGLGALVIGRLDSGNGHAP